MEIKEYTKFDLSEVLLLYQDAGWINYLSRREILEKAYQNSLIVLGAYENEKLVGLLRAVGDGETIIYIQDLLVLKEYQHQGVGKALMKSLLDKYPNVYQVVLLTDDVDTSKDFYSSLGFKVVRDNNCIAYIRMK